MSTSSFRLNNHESSDDSASLGAMGSLIRKLDELLETEDGKESIIQKFRDDVVGSIYTRLEKLSEVQDPPQTVNYWMKDVRELSYDMADFFNGLVHAQDAEVKVDEISEFEELVNDAIEQYDCYNLEKYLHQESQIPVRPRLGWAYGETEHVGMNNRIKELTSLVVPKGDDKGDWQLKVVSILGADQGVGKSTLAQKLWRASEIEFGTCRAFVLMAKKSDIRMTLRSILSQIRPHEPPCDYNVPYLIHDIKTHLQDKRYFIVIDDLWAISVWDIVRRAFPDSKNCSRILITTTVEDIAHACCSNRNNIFDIKPLSDKQTNELFLSRVFGPGKECPQELNVDSDEISRKCGGLPLAIICIATLVASQQEINQILDTETMKRQLDFVNNFLDNNLGARPTSVEILNQVLKLCYSSLPHYLKTCLLYLGMYPENYLIMKEDLVKQWISEGFIVEGKSIAKNASSYFDVLVSLGLIQQMDNDSNKKQHCQEKGQQEKEGQVVEVEEEEEEEESLMYSNRLSYVVHPTVYEFIISKCMEDNFITTIDYSQSKVALTERIHRLSLQFGSATYATTPTSIRLSQVRSLAFMGLWNCMPSLLEFKAVRVMILHIQSDERDERVSLAEIDKLLLLRYLQVRCNVTVQLPAQLQCLKQLETLEINAGVADVPTDIIQHSGLQHVRIGRKIKHKNLAQGPAIPTDPIFPKYLSRSNKPLSAVQVLELLPPICSFLRLPWWIEELTSVRILEVVVRELRNYDLDHLGELPVLTVLSLYVRKPDNREVVTFHRDALFPALESFKLVSGVLLLSFPEKAMPKLRILKLRFNARRGERYSDMLRGIQHLSKLKEVVARIGVADGAEESDMIAAESAYAEAISKHPSGLIISPNVKRVDKVDEEYDPPESSNKQEIEVLNEIQNEDPKQAYIQRKLPQEDNTHNTPRSNKDLVAAPLQQSTATRRQSQNEVWRRTWPQAALLKLRALLEHLPFSSVRDDIQFLYYEIQNMDVKFFHEPNRAREWLDYYRELVYDIEDWAEAAVDRVAVGTRSRPSSMVLRWFHRAVDRLMMQPMKRAYAEGLSSSDELRDFQVRVRQLHRLFMQKDDNAVPQPLPFKLQDMTLNIRPTSSLVGVDRPMEEVTEMLNLIYNNLPHIFKPCMLYLSIFPVYYEVDVERLMRLWIAEGFIGGNNFLTSMEETARSFLDELISRNMVLPLHVNHHGIPKRCMVHPVIHDFIVSKSREENFVAIVNDQHQDIANNNGTIRRVSLQSSSEKDPKVLQNTSMDVSHVRSIIVIGQASTAPHLTGLRLVRVLDLEGCDGTTICLDSLHKLQLLRYLSLRGSNVSELPDTIGKLRFLQTLDVRSTDVKELPHSIVSLEKLMHLLCGNAKLPPRIGEMKMLRTLSCATNSLSIIRELSRIVDLRELELFLDFTQLPRDEKQVTFSHHGFWRLRKLCVRCNSASVAFELNALMMVEVLELSFEGPLVNESSAVSGIEYLWSLKHVLLEFSQGDAGATMTVDAVKKAATKLQRRNSEVTVTVNERPLGSTST